MRSVEMNPSIRFASVAATGLGPFGASAAKVARKELCAAYFSSHPGSASAFAGIHPLMIVRMTPPNPAGRHE